MNRKFFLFILTIFLFVFNQNSFFELRSADLQSDVVEIKRIEILTGHIEIEGDLTYFFEDENYLVRIEMTFPMEYREEIKIVSNLTGSIWVKELDKRSNKGELEFSLTGSRNAITVDLEGRAPKALIAIEGSPAMSLDNRTIIGEKEFELFKILIKGVPVRLRSEQISRFMLSSQDIFDAKKKISEAQNALEKLKNSTNSDMKIVSDIIARIESLLAIANECLQEGAPKQALEIANQCLLLANSNILEDQVRMLNSILADTEIDSAESSKLILKALDEIESSRRSENIDKYIEHSANARNCLDTARGCYVGTVKNKISRFEFSVFEVIILAVVLTSILLFGVFYFIFQRNRKKVFEQGLEAGEKEAAERRLSPRDIILGKDRGEEE